MKTKEGHDLTVFDLSIPELDVLLYMPEVFVGILPIHITTLSTLGVCP